MSKMSASVKNQRAKEIQKPVINFMGGISYEVNPIDTLKMVTASSIFGEPQYYRDGEFAQKGVEDGEYECNPLFAAYSVLPSYFESYKRTSNLMEHVIDDALSYDFGATINWAVTLRRDFYMRLNPQVIMVRAAIHPNRVAFNEAHPGVFSEANLKVMSRADEPASQLMYYLYRNGSKQNVPNILKRNWASKLESLDRYSIHKYKSTGIGMIDVVRISHAHSELLDELLQKGNIEVDDQDNTWETLRAGGAGWQEIYSKVKLGHMALLRNLRGIFGEVDDREFMERVVADLKSGVKNGKQFPFRYLAAKRAIEHDFSVHFKSNLIDALEECMDIACENLPKLKGRTMCLSDNSGSAWGAFNSEYGRVTVAEIDNLSSVITARNSDEGYVGKFGDKLIVHPVSKRNGMLAQAENISRSQYDDVGASTENGIWIFFRDAINKKEHWDNIFIYSDQQAGHGGLYGTHEGKRQYIGQGFQAHGEYVDVAKLIAEYRRKVNPDVNVFSIQTAGYDNVVIPEYGYRTNLMYGWTGKELVFADTMIRLWDSIQHKACDQKTQEAADPKQ